MTGREALIERGSSPMNLADIRDVLRAEVIVGNDKLDLPVRAGTASDLMSDMLTGPTNGAVLLTGLCNVQVIRTSVVAGVVAVVLVRGKRPSQELISQAREHGLPLLSTPFTMFSACGRLFSKGLRGVEEKAHRQ
jgi:predicted transcriptional regulator